MTTHGYFITGTDTGIGKTWIAAGLITALRRRGRTVAGMKPVACGVVDTQQGPVNEDVITLLRQGSDPGLPHQLVNRYAFTPPVSPHLAARFEQTPIDIDTITGDLQELAGRAGTVIIEGAGGWEVPINDRQTMADIARACGLPVVLVVGIRLGCLNHALLTSRAITASGLELGGWIANRIEPGMLYVNENIETLRRRIAAPLLGVVPWLESFDAERIADQIDLDRLPGE